MKPAYWIVVLALAGGIIGYALDWAAGWSDVTVGALTGAIIGLFLASRGKSKPSA